MDANTDKVNMELEAGGAIATWVTFFHENEMGSKEPIF